MVKSAIVVGLIPHRCARDHRGHPTTIQGSRAPNWGQRHSQTHPPAAARGVSDSPRRLRRGDNISYTTKECKNNDFRAGPGHSMSLCFLTTHTHTTKNDLPTLNCSFVLFLPSIEHHHRANRIPTVHLVDVANPIRPNPMPKITMNGRYKPSPNGVMARVLLHHSFSIVHLLLLVLYPLTILSQHYSVESTIENHDQASLPRF